MGAATPKSKAGAKAGPSPWLASNPGKRWTEVFFLAYSPFWILWALCILVPLQLYEHAGDWGYMLIGTSAAAPCVVLPLLLPGPKGDANKPLHQRYWVKANVWIVIFSFIGNYFWTHYFYRLLGASYTFRSFRLNDVPICLYLMTHAYFCFYHALSNVLLRRVQNAFASSSPLVRRSAMGLVVFLLSYATAYGETLTIAHVCAFLGSMTPQYPHYTFVDRDRMYTVGSLFYAIYFFVSFPMFYRIDESAKGKRWTLAECAFDSLAAGMLVTILLDLWRLTVGSINSQGGDATGLPWIPA